MNFKHRGNGCFNAAFIRNWLQENRGNNVGVNLGGGNLVIDVDGGDTQKGKVGNGKD